MMMQDDNEKAQPDDMEKTQVMKPAGKAASAQVEATQYIGVVEQPQAEPPKEKLSERPYQPGTKKQELDDTQSVPRVDAEGREETPIQQPFPKNYRSDGVRELPPDKDLQQAARPQGSWLQTHKKKAALLAGGFILALFLGFMLAGYEQNKSEEAQYQRYQQEQAMQDKQKDLNQQEADLKQQQKELEQRKKELQKQEKELEEQSSRAKGRNEALNDEKSEGTLGKLIDKVTGKEDERQQSIQQNKETSAQADTSVEDVKQSINDAQQMLDNVNQKLDSVSQMKQEANTIADKAKDTYAENKGTIDTALYYAKQGANLLADWLLN